jgi:hypothetical protein
MTARSFGPPLEQACLSPGLWRIEGYTVERRKRAGTGAIRWWISRADERGAMLHVAVVTDLGRARDHIRREINR